MQLREAKVGQRVRVWVKTDIGHPTFVVAVPLSGNAMIYAHVLEQEPALTRTVLGWKKGEEQPTVMLLAQRILLASWEVQGFELAHEYGNHVECLSDEEESIPPTKKNYGNECPCGIHPSKCIYHRS